MPLQKQPFTLPLAQGMNQKKSPKVLTGGITLVENGVHRKDEELKKRPGWTSLARTKSDGTTIDSADACATYENELLMWSEDRILTWSPAQEKWYDRGAAYSAAVETKQIISATSSYNVAESVYYDGVVLVCYEIESGSSTMVRYQIYDYESGAILKSDTVITGSGNALRPKAMTIGTSFFVIYSVSATQINGAIINPQTGSVTSTVTMVTDLNVASYFDAIAVASDTIMLAYRNTAGNLSVKYFNASLGSRGAPYTDSTAAGDPSIIRLIPLSSSRVMVAYISLTIANIQCRVVSSAGSIGSAIDTGLNKTQGGYSADNITGHLSAADAKIYVQYTPSFSAPDRFIYKASVSTSGGANSSSLFLRSVGVATRGFVRNDVGFVGLIHTSDLQSTYFVVDENGVVVSRHQPGKAGGFTVTVGGSGCISSVWSAVSGRYEFAITNKTRVIATTDTADLFSFSGSATPSGANLYSPVNVAMTALDFQDNSNFSTAELGECLLIAGGALSMYDGLSVVEHGFFLFPEGLSSALAGGGSVADGSYLYVAVYEWQDAKGFTHRSAPSIPLAVEVTAGPKRVDVTVPTLRVTAKKSPRAEVTIALFRTKAEQTGPYYRVTSITSPTLNDRAADTVTIQDTLADGSLDGRDYLYTTGGVLDNSAALPSKFIKVWRGRIVLAGGEENVLQYSKPWAKGNPVEFAAENTLEIESDGGPVTALEILDERLVAYKEEHAYLTYGEGPDATGLGGAFAPLTRISTCDVGCIDQQSTAALPGAVILKSLKGYYLLGADLMAVYIGADIEDYNDLTVTSATLFATENEVRITHSDGDTLVYNYFFKKWSVFTNHTAVDAIRWLGSFVHLKSDGKVCVETDGTFRDDGTNYDVGVTTGWQSFAEVVGFQRIYKALIVGQYVSPVTLSVSAAYDFEDTWIDSGSLALTATGYRWQFSMNRQKCGSMRFRITAAVNELVTSGEGVRLTAMGLILGIKTPFGKLPSSSKAGLSTI